tara:strand:- start:31 stop:432 length:402 start_codon:yes stop_codon:yes gene_type:complete
MANGTIAFDTLSTSGQISGRATSLDSDYLVSGSSKAWINYTGSDASINDSLNITSTTDDATGKDTVTINNDMDNANYSATMGCSRNGATTADNQTEGFFAIATGSIKINTMRADNGAYADFTVVTMQIVGDLA